MDFYGNTNLKFYVAVFIFNKETSAHLISILDFSGGPVVSLLKEDLLHLAVLQVIQLSHRILSSLNKIHQHRIRTFTLQKRMLDGKVIRKKKNCDENDKSQNK